MSNQLGKLKIKRKSGTEKFVNQGKDIGFDLLSFWQWSASDLVSNATRGILAEYIVAQALGIADKQIRDEWAAYDLETKDGIKIEVKSAAFIQSWYQKQYSRISFRTPKTLSWGTDTNVQSKLAKRQSDVYVFALLSHKEKSTINPLDVSQWEFFVVPTKTLDARKRSQHSITLPSLIKICGGSIQYDDLKSFIYSALNLRR